MTSRVDPPTRRFLRSLYASLVLAASCLTYAEWPFLPQTVVLAAGVAVLMAVAYWLEGRWALSLTAANVVGAVIAVSTAAWLVQQFRRGGTLLEQLPMPAAMLPYLGPFVLILIPAKLLRPKHDGDLWWMQLIGLMSVALACALASDSVMGVLVLAYAVLAVRCLADFHMARLERAEPAVRLLPNAVVWLSVLAWVLVATGVAGLAAGITPRMTENQWEFASLVSQVTTGLSDERPAIDLNLSGDVVASNEVAFRVRAENHDGTPKLDLAPETRWRGVTFNQYEQGKWGSRSWVRTNPVLNTPVPPRGNPKSMRDAMGRLQRPRLELPDLGPESFSVIFSWPRPPKRVYYLADPLWPPKPGGLPGAPILTESISGRRSVWYSWPEGDVEVPRLREDVADVVYRQFIAPLAEPDLGPPINVDPSYIDILKVVTGLPAMQRFSNELLKSLSSSGQLPRVELPGPAQDLDARFHEGVARAFTAHLRASGQFQYTLSLDRSDLNLDPIEDFVLNVRAGHCNRFSSALALLLRCQGVPCRMVLGYLGCESDGDGKYAVRQSAAHSWVEALVQRPSPSGEPTWHWLTLDPTPGDAERTDASQLTWGEWLQSLQQSASELFRSYVLDLNRERQAQLRSWVFGERASDWVTQPRRAAVALAAALAVLAWVWPRRRPTTKAEADTPYARLREALRKSGVVRPRASQTGNEVLHELAHVLVARPDAATVLNPAGRVIVSHERVRFGGQVMDDATRSADEQDVQAVERELRSAARPPR